MVIGRCRFASLSDHGPTQRTKPPWRGDETWLVNSYSNRDHCAIGCRHFLLPELGFELERAADRSMVGTTKAKRIEQTNKQR